MKSASSSSSSFSSEASLSSTTSTFSSASSERSSSSGAAPLSGAGGKHLATVDAWQDKEKSSVSSANNKSRTRQSGDENHLGGKMTNIIRGLN